MASNPYSIADLVSDVRLLLDEQALDGSSFTADDATAGAAEVDDAELDNLIRGRIVEARNFVLGGCDASLLREDCEEVNEKVLPAVASIYKETFADRVAVRILFADGVSVLRPVSAFSPKWSRAVSEFIPKESAAYSMLWDKYATGTYERPKAAYGDTTVRTTTETQQNGTQVTIETIETKRSVELFSWKASDLLLTTPGMDESGITYLAAEFTLLFVRSYPLSELTSDVKVNSEPLRAALRYYLAGLVAGILADNRKDDFMHLATLQMGITGGES